MAGRRRSVVEADEKSSCWPSSVPAPGKRNSEGGIIDEEFRVEYVNERAELMGKAFVGLTVGCSALSRPQVRRISQAEYYQLGGYFNSIDERGIHSESADGAPMGPTLAWPTAKQAAAVTTARRNDACASARARNATDKRRAALSERRQTLWRVAGRGAERGSRGHQSHTRWRRITRSTARSSPPSTR